MIYIYKIKITHIIFLVYVGIGHMTLKKMYSNVTYKNVKKF